MGGELTGVGLAQTFWARFWVSMAVEGSYLKRPLNRKEGRRRIVDHNNNSENCNIDPEEVFKSYFPGASDQEIVNSFSVDPDATKRKEYLRDLVSAIHSRIEQTHNDWDQGSYRDEFVNNTGTDAGSSLSLLINGLNEFYEDIRRDKIGTPSGIQDLGFTSPDKVEAVYSGISLDLLRTSIEACQTTFNGGSSSGLDDYLDAFNAEKNGEALSKLIKDSFSAAISSLDEIDGTLAEAVDNDKNDVRTAYTEISRQVIQLKTDMPAVMCVAITYVDNPSDSD